MSPAGSLSSARERERHSSLRQIMIWDARSCSVVMARSADSVAPGGQPRAVQERLQDCDIAIAVAAPIQPRNAAILVMEPEQSNSCAEPRRPHGSMGGGRDQPPRTMRPSDYPRDGTTPSCPRVDRYDRDNARTHHRRSSQRCGFVLGEFVFAPHAGQTADNSIQLNAPISARLPNDTGNQRRTPARAKRESVIGRCDSELAGASRSRTEATALPAE